MYESVVNLCGDGFLKYFPNGCEILAKLALLVLEGCIQLGRNNAMRIFCMACLLAQICVQIHYIQEAQCFAFALLNLLTKSVV